MITEKGDIQFEFILAIEIDVEIWVKIGLVQAPIKFRWFRFICEIQMTPFLQACSKLRELLG